MKKQLIVGALAFTSLALLTGCVKKTEEEPVNAEVVETTTTDNELNSFVNEVVEGNTEADTGLSTDSETTAEPVNPNEKPLSDHELGLTNVHNSDGEDYLDLTYEDAQAKANAAGVELRVVSIDGKEYPITDDLKEGRVNISLVDNVVTAVDVERINP